MNVLPDNYATVLDGMNVPQEAIDEARSLLDNKELRAALEHPFYSKEDKRNVIDKLFPAEIKNFIKVVSDNGDVAAADDIFEAYAALQRKKNNSCRAVFTYVTKPDDTQIAKLKKVICKQYNKSDVELSLKEDDSLVGGFILQVDDFVLDKSLKTAMLNMKRHFAAR